MRMLIGLLFVTLLGGCAKPASAPADLVGAWRSSVQFKDGAFAAVQDLEFLYVFNQGGTLTESSNYDALPPVVPAYGAWRAVGAGEFEAHYEFFVTRPPAMVDELAKGGGWAPAGRGILVERIQLAPDGQSFTSTIRLDLVDSLGVAAPGSSTATGQGRRIRA